MDRNQVSKFMEILGSISSVDDLKKQFNEEETFKNISISKKQLTYALDIKDIFDEDLVKTESKLVKDDFFQDLFFPKPKVTKPRKKNVKPKVEIKDLDYEKSKDTKKDLHISKPMEVAKMKEISSYRIERAKTEFELQQKVERAIKLGWQPFGGVGAAAFGVSPVGGNSFMQALVKYKK